MYKTITIKAGSGGWGGPLTIVPTEKCNKILSVTGGSSSGRTENCRNDRRRSS